MTEFSNKQLETIQRTVAAWNLDKSVRRAGEELLELALALMHYERDKVDAVDVLNEMADVKIALKGLEFIFGSYQAQLNEKVIKGNGS